MKIKPLFPVLSAAFLFFSGCATTSSELQWSDNEEIRFLQMAKRGLLQPTDEEVQKWKIRSERAVMPESAEFTNVTDMRLLVATNPDRYESYISYCRNLATRGIADERAMTEEEADAAIYAYEISQKIIERDGVTNPIDGRKFYSIALMMKYLSRFEDKQRNPENVRWFDKITEVYPAFFFDISNSDFPLLICSAAIDHWKLGNQEYALELIEMAKRLPATRNEQLRLIRSSERMIQAGPPKTSHR